MEVRNELYEQKTRLKELYEILLIYNIYFINPIIQKFEFFDDFIKNIIENFEKYQNKEYKENREKKGKKEKKEKNENKAYSKFLIGLNYIKDIEIFLKVIDTNKNKIYTTFIKPDNDPKKYEKYFIKMDKSFKFKNEEKSTEDEISSKINIKSEQNNDTDNKVKKEIPVIIESIKSIIEFCQDNDIFLIYFTSDFWKYLLNFCRKPIMDNIENCDKLRNSFIEYHELVIRLFPKKDKLKINTDANNLWEIDDFAILLDKIIKKYNEDNKNVSDIEKLDFVTKYNPYYQISKDNKYTNKYANKADIDILDLFDINNVDKEFIIDFRGMNFEIIFEGNIYDYILKIISKIKNISNFENIVKLINFQNI